MRWTPAAGLAAGTPELGFRSKSGLVATARIRMCHNLSFKGMLLYVVPEDGPKHPQQRRILPGMDRFSFLPCPAPRAAHVAPLRRSSRTLPRNRHCQQCDGHILTPLLLWRLPSNLATSCTGEYYEWGHRELKRLALISTINR